MAQVLTILPGVDEATARLILEMQTADLEELSNARNAKGKQRQGEVDDFTLALQLYQAELQSTSTAISDHQMAASFAQAARRDGELIAELTAQESQATQDRRMALAINGGDTAAAHAPPTARDDELDIDEALLQRLAALNNSQSSEEEDGVQAESSSWAASRHQTSTNPQRRCVICMDNFAAQSDTIQAPCGDSYCRPCLVELFTCSLTDESLYPPRCHGRPIPAEENASFLGAPLLGRFLAKKLEFETPDRTYCYRPQCAAFIPPQFVRDGLGRCVQCGDRTCAVCKKEVHPGDCPDDPATQEMLRVAQEEGWQRCPSCLRLVELRTGCNHITCRCTAQFCYVCAALWKNCACANWDEERLVERANVLVDREPRGERPAPQAIDGYLARVYRLLAEPSLDDARQRRIDEMRQRLVADHECAHQSWTRIEGPRDCEECGDEMPLWLNECRQCHIMVCRRCKLNRL